MRSLSIHARVGVALCVALALPTAAAASERFDVVIINGTVVDPETHCEALCELCLAGAKRADQRESVTGHSGRSEGRSPALEWRGRG